MPRWIPLSVLVQEQFASSASAMWDYALDHELPVALDGKGRACMAASAADRLRQEQAEAEARAAAERESRRQERLDAEIEAAVAAERQQQLRDRERRLVEATGLSLPQLEGAMRQEPLNRPGAGFVVQDLDAVYNRPISLDDMEQFVRDAYGPDVLERYEHAS